MVAGFALALAALLPTSAFATAFDFDVSYDGIDATNVGALDPIGVVLEAGDSFDYNLQAISGGSWEVLTSGLFFPFLAFDINEAGVRIGDFSLTLSLDGTEQFSIMETGVRNAAVHFG